MGIGLIDEIPDPSNDVGMLLQTALDKIAFIPFGLMVDQWRWKVMAGEVGPEDYNELWWNLRDKYQGIMAPVDRDANAFDPGAKYHVRPMCHTPVISLPTSCSSSSTRRCVMWQ